MTEQSPADRPAIDSESLTDRVSITGRSTPDYRSAITSSPAARLDGRSAIGRRVADLFKALMTRLGNPVDIVIQADITALAELKAAAETARVRLLKGESQDTNGLVRLENLVRRAEARVGLEPATAVKEEPSWQDIFIEEQEPAEASQ
jgi:hypothetical protein